MTSDLAFSWRSSPKSIPYSARLAGLMGFIMGWLHLPFVAAWLVVIPLAAMLFLVAREPSAKGALRIGFFGWLGFWSVHLFWLPQSFSLHFGWAVWLLMPLLWLIEALLNALMLFVAHRLTKTSLGMVWLAAMLTLLLEFIRANMGALAFPWGFFGYALIGTPLAQLAAVGGVYLLSFLVLALAAAIASVGFYEWRILPLLLGVVVVGLVYGMTRPVVNPPSKNALLVQGNIDPFGRLARPTGKSDLEIFLDLSKPKNKNAVIIYPEAALGLQQLANVEGSSNVPKIGRLIAGVADYRQGLRLNSVAAIRDGQLFGTSTKAHLVPFGEYYPLRRELAFIYEPIFGLLGLGTGFAGMELVYQSKTLTLDGERFGTYVCYDSVFPDVARARSIEGAQVLVNVSNDGWFGRTWGIEQHFIMGRMRAIETGRYILRVGNTGITAVIDPHGNVLQRAPIQQSLALEARYGLEATQTLYVRFGDWAIWLAVLVGLLAIVGSRTSTDAW